MRQYIEIFLNTVGLLNLKKCVSFADFLSDMFKTSIQSEYFRPLQRAPRECSFESIPPWWNTFVYIDPICAFELRQNTPLLHIFELVTNELFGIIIPEPSSSESVYHNCNCYIMVIMLCYPFGWILIDFELINCISKFLSQ